MQHSTTECLKTPDSQSYKSRQEPTLQSELEEMRRNNPELYRAVVRFFNGQRVRNEKAFGGEKK